MSGKPDRPAMSPRSRVGRVRLGPSARAIAFEEAYRFLLHVRRNRWNQYDKLPPEQRVGWRLAAQALRSQARTELAEADHLRELVAGQRQPGD